LDKTFSSFGNYQLKLIMKKFLKQLIKTIIFILFIFLLAIIQVTFVNRYNLLGATPNLVLIGLMANIFSPNFLMVILGLIVGGMIYDFSGLFNFISLSSFLLTIIIFRFLGKKYILKKHLFLNFLFGILGTIIYNFFYILLNYFFSQANFFQYFFSLSHLVEIGINALGVFIFCLIAELFSLLKSSIFKK